MNMTKYYNFKDGLNSKPKLLTMKELEALSIDKSKDAYVSIYTYNDEHKKKYEQTGSLAGIKDVVTNTLVWDFDSVNVEDAQKDTLALAHRLVDKYNTDPDNIVCYWSGSKGFHVILPIDRDITPDQFKQATLVIAEGLQTYDPSVNDPQRILRLEHTKHPKTGMYKIPLHIEEVDTLNIKEIKQMAETPRIEFKSMPVAVKLPDVLFKIQEKVKVSKVLTDDFDASKCPKGWKPYKWALAEGYFESGDRHQALLVVAATCRALGYSKEHAYYLCKAALKKQSERSGQAEFSKEELWDNIIEGSVYSDRWEGGAFSPTNNLWLATYCEKMGIKAEKDDEADKIVQLCDIEAEFVDFVKNIDSNTILTGIKEVDKAMPLTVGMNLGVIGAASSGKTALALKILKNTSDAGVVSVFASLDMRRNRLFEKLLYRVSGLPRDELYRRIQKEEAGDIFQKVKEEYKNVYFYDRSCPTVDDIRRYIMKLEEDRGVKVKMVMLDYFERVGAERSDDTAASKEVAGKLQDLVNDFNICMITLVQPNKFSLSGGPDSPITSYTAIKGSSFIYQSFRSIISIWRPFFTPDTKNDDKYLQMAILKNDLGELEKFSFGWEGKRGEIWTLSEEEQDTLDELLRKKAESKVKEGTTYE